ncbi:MAG: hypothetical protein R2716_07370 [Microthrixaceae bacterium]
MGNNLRSPAEGLLELTTTVLEELVSRHLAGWRVPGFMGGHPVEPDVAADLALTLGHLHDAGVAEVADTDVVEAISTLLSGIDGSRTHTFFSYRVAETLGRFGTFSENPLLEGLDERAWAEIARATDSTDWIELLDLGLPRNYAAVLARCEVARARLGLEVDEAVLSDLLARTEAMLGADPLGRLDDSTHGVGRVDIYTVDVWLFTEALADRLGELWARGLRGAVELVEHTGSPDGAAIPWGRSTGSLGTALTIELAALVLGGRVPTARTTMWSSRLSDALANMSGWFRDGLVEAHVDRGTYAYRGPFRRLQMTADLLGKLAWAAAQLREAPSVADGRQDPASFDHDELIPLTAEPPTRVWSVSDGGRGFVVPFVGATRSDYLAAPRRPGVFEVPVDSGIGCWVPVVHSGSEVFAPAGAPGSVELTADGVVASWGHLERLGDLDPEPGAHSIPGTARIHYAAEGRAIRVEARLELARRPRAVAVTVPETSGCPLRVEALGGGTGERTDGIGTLETAGIAEWRSFWAELPRVHQLDVPPAHDRDARYELSYRVTPAIRVASSAHGHHYDDCLYGPLASSARAVSVPGPLGPLADGSVGPGDYDVFHLHWPEWLAFDDLEEHRRIVAELRRLRKPVLWTAHNLTPHAGDPAAFGEVYRLWALNADAVIHHSEWGREQMLRRYDFGERTSHRVVPHGHFGDLYPSAATPRDEAARRLDLPEAEIRIGLLGAPRRGRDVEGFLEAVASSDNEQVQVCCWSLERHLTVPGDARIAVAERYRMVDPETYGLRLAACDVLALPVDPDTEMLGTGLAADVVGAGLAALCTTWGYCTEVLGEAAIPLGHGPAAMARSLDGLDTETVRRAQLAAEELREAQSWERSSRLTLQVLEELLD